MDHPQMQTTSPTAPDRMLKLSSATSFWPSKNQGWPLKRGRVFAYTCGGAHMIQGVNHAKLRGFGHSSLDGPIKVGRSLDLSLPHRACADRRRAHRTSEVRPCTAHSAPEACWAHPRDSGQAERIWTRGRPKYSFSDALCRGSHRDRIYDSQAGDDQTNREAEVAGRTALSRPGGRQRACAQGTPNRYR